MNQNQNKVLNQEYKGDSMQFLSLLEAIASNINATNIDQFIKLVEGLVSLCESAHSVNKPE